MQLEDDSSGRREGGNGVLAEINLQKGLEVVESKEMENKICSVPWE